MIAYEFALPRDGSFRPVVKRVYLLNLGRWSLIGEYVQGFITPHSSQKFRGIPPFNFIDPENGRLKTEASYFYPIQDTWINQQTSIIFLCEQIYSCINSDDKFWKLLKLWIPIFSVYYTWIPGISPLLPWLQILNFSQHSNNSEWLKFPFNIRPSSFLSRYSLL